MKYINSLWILTILCLTQCTQKEDIVTNLEGKYMGTLTSEWEKINIKNFNVNPDTTHSSNKFIQENVQLTIEGYNFRFTYLDRIITGRFLIEVDSITFLKQSSNCPDDCAEYLLGEKVKYEINQSALKLTFFLDWYERQYNFADKDFTKEKRVYELVKTN